MAYRHLRDYLGALEEAGMLRRIAREVDGSWEPACLAKWVYQALPAEERFGLLFERVKGSEARLATGALGASTRTYAMALGAAPESLNELWRSALSRPIAPRKVAAAPCQEVVRIGAEADLASLPIPSWTPGKDAGPYITAPVVTRDAQTGVQNMGVYRTLVADARRVVVNLSPGRQGTACCKGHTDAGRPAPIAWVIGAEPAVQVAAVANLPPGQDEIRVAGGLVGEPIELVRAKTVDLMVPANAEIVIEGEIHPGELGREGPFGEFAGYMSPVEERPVARITAITHRAEPIYYGFTSQMPPSESTVLQSLTNAGVVYKILRSDFGDAGIADVAIDLTFGGLLGHCVVAMTPRYPGHAKRIGRIVADLTPLKRVTVVDADVDIRDPLHLDWAMNACFDPARDTVIIDDVYVAMHMDPSVRPRGGGVAAGSKIVVDATRKIDAGTFSLPPKEMMMRALDLWRAAGLPAFEVPKRVHLRLERP